MLEKLSISNYALIESVEISFDKGFSIVTGETGAGKSIMLDALSLLMGDRADTSMMRDSTHKTVVEAVFRSNNKELKAFLQSKDLEWSDGEIIVRREIAAEGRSRAFVNDTPVKINLLSELSTFLVDIHSQHCNTRLFESKAQLDLLDAVADNAMLLEAYKDCFKKYVALRMKIENLRRDAAKNRENRDFIMFRLEQLDKLKPRKGELVELERKYEMLSDAAELKENLAVACSKLDGGENSALSCLSVARASLGKVNLGIFDNDSNDSSDLPGRLESLYIELKDIVETLQDYAESITEDPNELMSVSQRLNELYDAQKRFKVSDFDSLIQMYDDLKKKMAYDYDDPAEIADLEKEMKSVGAEMKRLGESLTSSRSVAAQRLSDEIIEICKGLGLPNLRFSILLSKGKYTSAGCDNVCFLCSFNKKQKLQPMEKTASGGELSRLMLSIKSILARKWQLPTVIFDEIDTGVSGDIADKMGRMMNMMSKDIQVIAITHLPQVAAKGTSHYKVYKKDEGDATLSYIIKLNETQRVNELAVMLSGKTVDEAAVKNAISLLNQK